MTGKLAGDPSNQRSSASDKQDLLQEAQEQFVLDTRVLRDSTTDSTVANQQEYSLPSDVMDIIRIGIAGIEKGRISKADLDFYNSARWDQTQGTPQYYYVDLDPNNKKFGLYPYPTASGSSDIAIEYLKIPPTLSADSSVPLDSHTLLTPYHNALAYYAAANLCRTGRSGFPLQDALIKGNGYWGEYERLVSHCIETFKHMEQSQGWRMIGGRYHKNL